MINAPTVTIVMPVYNTSQYVEEAIDSVLDQTFEDFELLIIDDGGTDESMTLCRAYTDPRIHIISQENRGLSGARNTGIREASGQFIALLDSDDVWEPVKLGRHVRHLKQNPRVGISFAASRTMDADGRAMRVVQKPKLKNISASDIYLRNPVGNGSAPVFRQEVFQDIAFPHPTMGYPCYFDESFRQSEDIECWMRIALTTGWKFEGVSGSLTRYRVNESGLSANVIRQFEAWDRMRAKIDALDPDFSAKWTPVAQAFQFRYLARRCVCRNDGSMALNLMRDALRSSPSILWREPQKTCTTLAAAAWLRIAPELASASLQTALRKA